MGGTRSAFRAFRWGSLSLLQCGLAVALGCGGGGGDETSRAEVPPRPPSVTSATTATAFAGHAFVFGVRADGHPAPAVAVSPLPAWLAFDAPTARLAGTPGGLDLGSFAVTVTATNALGTATETLAITVEPGPGLDLAAAPLIEALGPALPAAWASAGGFRFGDPATGGAGASAFPPAAFDGPCAGTGLDAAYASGVRSILQTPVLDLGAVPAPVLRFHHFYNLEEFVGTFVDGANLKWSDDGGRTFAPIEDVFFVAPTPPYPAVIDAQNPFLAGEAGWGGLVASGDWEEVVVDLDLLLGASRDQVVIRFEQGTDALGGRPGWFIDDVRIGAALAVPIRPVLTGPSSASAIEGTPFSFQIAVAGQPAPQVQVAGLTSAALQFDPATGRIAGTPDAADVAASPYSLSVTATNAAARGTATQTLTLHVGPVGSTPPAITSTAPTTATAGALYTYRVTADGNPPPAVAFGGLPGWLTFDGVDAISGVPSVLDAGTSGPLQAKAANVAGTDAEVFTILVSLPPSGAPLAGAPLVERFAQGARPPGWGATGDWEIGLPPPRAGNGADLLPGPVDGPCAGTLVATNYTAQTRSRLVTPTLDLAGALAPRLRFRHFFNAEGPGLDGGNLKVSVDGGVGFALVDDAAFVAPTRPYTGSLIASTNPLGGEEAWSGLTPAAEWEEVEVDLDVALGAAARDRVVLSFEFGSDGQGERAGWFVDDVRIGAEADLPLEPTIAVTEVLNNPRGGGAEVEWVELYNYGPRALDLGGWQVRDDGAGALQNRAALPPGTVLPPGGFLIVVATGRKASFEAHWLGGAVDARVVETVGVSGFPAFVLGNLADQVVLVDDASTPAEAWRLAYIDDEVEGLATHLANGGDFRLRAFGTRAVPGVARSGGDNGSAFLGYEGALGSPPDPLARTSANPAGTDTASPLAGSYAVPGAPDSHEPDDTTGEADARGDLVEGVALFATATDARDVYRVAVPLGQERLSAFVVLREGAAAGPGSLDLEILDASGSRLHATASAASGAAALTVDLPAAGTHYLAVAPSAAATGQAYEIAYDLVPPVASGGPDAHEEDDDRAGADQRGALAPETVALGNTVGDVDDLYLIQVPVGLERVEACLAFGAAAGDLDLVLEDASGAPVGASASPTAATESLRLHVPLGGGVFYLRVRSATSPPSGQAYALRYRLARP